MARTREFDPQKTLQTAIEMFWEKGYFDGSVDELVKRSGVAKYGIYSTFGSKRELFLAVLRQYGLDRRHDILRPVLASDASRPEIEKFFRGIPKLVVRSSSHRRGCLLCNTAIELGIVDSEVRSIINTFFDDVTDQLTLCLKRASERKEIDAETDIARMARYLATEYRCAVMLASSGLTRGEIDAHLEFVLEALS